MKNKLNSSQEDSLVEERDNVSHNQLKLFYKFG